MSDQTKSAGPAGKAPRLVLWLTVLTGVGLGVLFVFPAIFVIVCVGMAPSMIAVFVDPDRNLRALPCTVALNLAGVIPVVALLWQQGNSLNDATELLHDVFIWALMYTGVALSMFLLWIAPVIVKAVLETVARHGRWRLERARERMLKEWGEGIAEAAKTPSQDGAVAKKLGTVTN